MTSDVNNFELEKRWLYMFVLSYQHLWSLAANNTAKIAYFEHDISLLGYADRLRFRENRGLGSV